MAEKKEKVKIGRPVVVDNTYFGPGEYEVTPDVARKLRARNATATVAGYMRAEKEKERRAAEEASGEGQGDPTGTAGGGGGEGGQITGQGTGGHVDTDAPRAGSGTPGLGTGGGPTQTGVIIGGKPQPAPGEGGPAGGGDGDAGATGVIIGGKTGDDGDDGATSDDVASLTGKLPDDFPKRDELAKGNPEEGIKPVKTYEALVKLTAAELDRIPGIGPASVEQIGQRLFADAQKKKAGGGEQ